MILWLFACNIPGAPVTLAQGRFYSFFGACAPLGAVQPQDNTKYGISLSAYLHNATAGISNPNPF